MRRPAFDIAAAAIVLVALAAAGAPGASEGTTGLRALLRPGETAPAFALNDLDGRKVTVNPAGGKPSLIIFFSAFCPLCRELAPSVREAAARRSGAVRFIGVNLDGKRFSNAVRSFVAENGFDFPVLLDEIRNDMFVAADPYGVDKTPTAVLVDGHGSVRGAYAAESMRELLRDFDRIVAGSEHGNDVTK